MTSIRVTRRVRILAASLAMLLAAPYVTAGAYAATADPARTDLCVLDFNDVSRSAQTGLGATAAARFADRLANREEWSVTDDARVRSEVKSQTLAAPFGRAARAPPADVRLMVLVEDAGTGELLQSAISEGTSAPAAGASATRETLLNEALTNAATSFASYLASNSSTGTPPVACGTVAAGQGAGVETRPPTAGTATVTRAQAQQILANVSAPDPIVVDVPGGGLDGTVRTEKRPLISNRIVKLLVGGAMVMGLLYLAGAGGIGATRPF
ncbi:MAG: hypothetical protein K0Q72_5473 [Armatimonadetes bacterium]|nr:hypothetical protein [Armatimonadota bacterium]